MAKVASFNLKLHGKETISYEVTGYVIPGHTAILPHLLHTLDLTQFSQQKKLPKMKNTDTLSEKIPIHFKLAFPLQLILRIGRNYVKQLYLMQHTPAFKTI